LAVPAGAGEFAEFDGAGPFGAVDLVVAPVLAGPRDDGAGGGGADPSAAEAGFATPSGMAAGGGTASRRPAPVTTPRKNRSDAPRTAAAIFTARPPS
jgi:hypothetical protein